MSPDPLFTRRAFALTALAGVAMAGPLRAGDGMRLLMVQKRGCIYCAAWDREIAPGYATSGPGRRAPLMRVEIDGPWPDGLALASRPFVTPTFILLRGGVEIGRIQGYAGPEWFFADLDRLLAG